MRNNIPITEMFNAIQGEGPEAGVPTFFVRTSGCNIEPKCGWCDSKYSWDKKGLSYPLHNLKSIVSTKRHVTITGGEPCLHDEELESIINDCPTTKFSLETNGTIFSSAGYNSIIVSPKRQMVKENVISRYVLRSNRCMKCTPGTSNINFKFVYEDGNDNWWEGLIARCNIPRNKVFIMPEGKTREEQIEKMPEVMEYCRDQGYNFSPRLQVLAYDQRRKV